MLNQDSCMFYEDLAVYEGFGGHVLAKEEGENISRALEEKKNLILQNHGLITASSTVGEAAAFFYLIAKGVPNAAAS
ncbi:L-fuculose-phosphate aldolase [Blastomyces dermatitidis ER-3]|uniref:L-fuculose-phosphate aldolase n=1 Tax=Ajellomyces dermatitidis (strain ER-3 / ATCC MYA-2586) TaxID=559297 RepID=A0ABP2EN96_AJEDR|nr:L-fuculose-phosphate aldolase [Blastomyces dermatitidis ER-3]EEQ84878.2 L-fuculose-phosphate aldolase [Blastomyces dermatitidis ER-3]